MDYDHVLLLIMITGKFPEANTRANDTHPEDFNKRSTEKKQEREPVDPKKGSVTDSSKHHKLPNPLPLPSKK